jgi:hypothetical protein
VSAYVAAALEEKTKLDDLAALIDEMLSESGTNDVIDASARAREGIASSPRMSRIRHVSTPRSLSFACNRANLQGNRHSKFSAASMLPDPL